MESVVAENAGFFSGSATQHPLLSDIKIDGGFPTKVPHSVSSPLGWASEYVGPTGLGFNATGKVYSRLSRFLPNVFRHRN